MIAVKGLPLRGKRNGTALPNVAIATTSDLGEARTRVSPHYREARTRAYSANLAAQIAALRSFGPSLQLRMASTLTALLRVRSTAMPICLSITMTAFPNCRSFSTGGLRSH